MNKYTVVLKRLRSRRQFLQHRDEQFLFLHELLLIVYVSPSYPSTDPAQEGS